MGDEIMRVLVCGGRQFTDRHRVFAALDALAEKFQGRLHIIHGAASGADTLAADWAAINFVQATAFPAKWVREDGTRDPSAGPKRNQRMLIDGRPNLVVAFPGWNGTDDMCRRARRAGVPVRQA